jgi:hypothetical protein
LISLHDPAALLTFEVSFARFTRTASQAATLMPFPLIKCLIMATRLGRALCSTLSFAFSTYATADDDLFDQHHAHEHGLATLDIA